MEMARILMDALEGLPVSDTAKALFRSPSFVKGIVNRVGVPHRPPNPEKRAKFGWIPDTCVAQEFQPGEIVWSAKYHRCAVVKNEIKGNYENKYGSKCYAIYVVEPVDAEGSYFEHIEKGGFNAYALAYDLGKLDHLKEYGVDLSRL
jgi:hypothetical protein